MSFDHPEIQHPTILSQLDGWETDHFLSCATWSCQHWPIFRYIAPQWPGNNRLLSEIQMEILGIVWLETIWIRWAYHPDYTCKFGCSFAFCNTCGHIITHPHMVTSDCSSKASTVSQPMDRVRRDIISHMIFYWSMVKLNKKPVHLLFPCTEINTEQRYQIKGSTAISNQGINRSC